MAQPIQVEEQLVPLSKLPPVQLSICRVYSIDPRANPKNMAILGTVPTYVNTTAVPFWSQQEARGERFFHLWDYIAELAFWNESSASWDSLYGKKLADTSLFDMAVYPYEGNSTLLCYTLQPTLATFGTRFQMVTAAALESSRCDFHKSQAN
jgi:hypothetical protein